MTTDEHQHKQVTVDANGWRADVDESMAPLIRLLWEHGIRTIASCQGDRHADGLAEIGFASSNDYMKFASVILPWALDHGGARLGHVWDSQPAVGAVKLPPGWRAGFMLTLPVPFEVGTTALSSAVTLAFPPADIKPIRKQLARRRT